MKAKPITTTDLDTLKGRIDKAYSEGWEFCICCGKRIKDRSKSVEIEIIEGGSYWTIGEKNDPNDPGYMGAWSLGQSCYRTWRKTWND